MIIYSSLLLLLCSPLLLAIAYYIPDHFSFAIFFFLIPLFYLVLTHTTKKSSGWFVYGMLWGMIFYSLHWVTFVPLFLNYAYGWLRWMIYPFLVLYASLWTGAWFFICSLSYKRLLLSWTVGTFLYFYLFEQYVLVPFGCNAGYPFTNPVMFLYFHFPWCSTVPFLSRHLLLMVLIFFQIGCVYSYVTRQVWLLPGIVLMLLLFLWGGELEHHDVDSNMICCVGVSPPTDMSCLEAAQNISATLLDARIEHPDAQVFILPESAFPFCLNKHPEIIELWTENVLHEDKTLVIGSHYLDREDHLFNTVYIIKGCRITQTYHKKHLIPFIEYLPAKLKNNTLFTSLFFNKNRPFTPEESPRNHILDINQTKYSVAICSEFFLYNHHYREEGSPLIIIVNDSWFTPYFQYLMYLYACFHARTYRIPIIYSGYHYSSSIYYYS